MCIKHRDICPRCGKYGRLYWPYTKVNSNMIELNEVGSIRQPCDTSVENRPGAVLCARCIEARSIKEKLDKKQKDIYDRREKGDKAKEEKKWVKNQAEKERKELRKKPKKDVETKRKKLWGNWEPYRRISRTVCRVEPGWINTGFLCNGVPCW